MGIVTTGQGFTSPMLDKINEQGKLGSGDEFTRNIRNDYWQQPTGDLGDDLDFKVAPILLRRAAGGTATPTEVVATECFDHDFTLQSKAAGRQLPSTTFWDVVGGDEWGYAGGVVDQFVMQFQTGQPPKYSASIMTSGFHKALSAVSPTLTLPEPQDLEYAYSADILLELNDGSLLNVSERIRSLTFTLRNNHRQNDRRPGDSPLVANDYSKGAYVKRCLRGDRECSVEYTLLGDENKREYLAMLNNTAITGFRILARGPRIGTGSPARYNELEISLPKVKVMEAARGNDGNDVTRAIRIMALKGAGQNYVNFRVRNRMSTLS
jgi:hypothetical protein